MVKLEELLLARQALVKIANSPSISPNYAWELADFMDDVNKKFRQFDKVRQNLANDCKIENEDGTTGFDEEKYAKGLEDLLGKIIDIDVSILDAQKLQKVEGLTVTEIMSINELKR